MATRGLRILFALPVCMALFVVGSAYLTRWHYTDWVLIAQPDQVALQFLHALNTGQPTIAARLQGTGKSPAYLAEVGQHLTRQYGHSVTCTARIMTMTPRHAVVWSDTQTNLGYRYTITWTVQRQGFRWVITDVGTLREMLPEMNGL